MAVVRWGRSEASVVPEPPAEGNAALWTYYRPRAAELTRKREARRTRARTR